MTEYSKLFVNLSASQTRKRLKGYGLGVKKVEAAGRNQAVIVHTATGRHLERLRRLVGDVLAAGTQDELDIPVENLRNLGATSAGWLRDVGLHSREDLERVGPVFAYLQVRTRYPQASLNLLWALAGALRDIDCRDLSSDEKQALQAELP